LLFTVAFVHRCQVLLKLHHHTVHRYKASNLPFTLATSPSSQVLPYLLHLDHMTQYHVSCAMSSFIITCVSFATSPSHLHRHDICCSHTCTCGLITCVSHSNTISPPKVVTQLPKLKKDLSTDPTPKRSGMVPNFSTGSHVP
jgi:hypothetical protein